MGPLEYLSDVLSKAEHLLEQNKGKWEDFKIVFKKKLHLDPTFASDDAVENNLDYCQLMHDIIKGEWLLFPVWSWLPC